MRFPEATPIEHNEIFSSGKDTFVQRYLYRNFSPKRHLEFGTWKGEGVKRVLEECGASVWTINLWEGESSDSRTWAYGEEAYGTIKLLGDMEVAGKMVRTDAKGMIGREYLEASLGHRVNQIYADSRLWEDHAYPDGFFDSAFVDGGHDAETARSDMYKAIRLLRPGGMLLLHDFCPLPEVNAQHPSTVGVTGMVAEELERIRAMCDDVFWIEGTWLLCGIRKKELSEDESTRERAWFAEARQRGRTLAEKRLAQSKQSVQQNVHQLERLYIYEQGTNPLPYIDITVSQDSLLTPGNENPHLATPYFWLPGRPQGVLTLTLDIRFSENGGATGYHCMVQDTNFTPLAECFLDAGAYHQQRQLRIIGVPETSARLVLTPATQEPHAIPVFMHIACDNMSAAVVLFEEMTKAQAQRDTLLSSRWRKLGLKLGIVKKLPFE